MLTDIMVRVERWFSSLSLKLFEYQIKYFAFLKFNSIPEKLIAAMF